MSGQSREEKRDGAGNWRGMLSSILDCMTLEPLRRGDQAKRSRGFILLEEKARPQKKSREVWWLKDWDGRLFSTGGGESSSSVRAVGGGEGA